MCRFCSPISPAARVNVADSSQRHPSAVRRTRQRGSSDMEGAHRLIHARGITMGDCVDAGGRAESPFTTTGDADACVRVQLRSCSADASVRMYVDPHVSCACPVMSCHVMSCPVMSCHFLPCSSTCPDLMGACTDLDTDDKRHHTQEESSWPVNVREAGEWKERTRDTSCVHADGCTCHGCSSTLVVHIDDACHPS